MRRTIRKNVNSNRGFQDFSKALPVNPEYAELHDWLLPEQWQPDAGNNLAIATYLKDHGSNAFQSAVTPSLQSFPDGLFFGAGRVQHVLKALLRIAPAGYFFALFPWCCGVRHQSQNTAWEL